MNKKIFCIGFNKSGTLSLHRFFSQLGLSSTHNTSWSVYSRINDFDKRYFSQQCYSDGEKADFLALDKRFPNSLFILNNRDERAWLYSRIKHVMRHNEPVNRSNILTKARYGWMARDFYFNEELCLRKWICERRIYTLQVRDYFRDSIRFHELDITTSQHYPYELIDFLDENKVLISQSDSPTNQWLAKIHANRRDEGQILNKKLLNKYMQLADKILAEM